MNVATVLNYCAHIYVTRICRVNFFVPQEVPNISDSLSAIRTKVETERNGIEFAKRSLANDHVSHASSGHQPDKQAHPRALQFMFVGKPKAFQLLRSIVEAQSPGIFEISYGGEHRNFELSQVN